MELLSQEQRRMVIGKFYEQHQLKGKAYCVRHFVAMGMVKGSIYRILNRTGMKRVLGSGGHNIKMNQADRKRLKINVNHKTGVSQRKLGSKFNVSQMTISRTIKDLGIKYFKRKRAPKSTPKQVEDQKKRLSALRRGPLKPTAPEEIVMDDEAYFTLDGSGMPGNSGFYTSDKSTTPISIKCYGKKKFPERVMVWCAISQRGVSKVFVLERGERMNHIIYTKILRSHLLPFIDDKYESRAQIVFWPDLATCHYHKDVITWLANEQITTITKQQNPPNAPAIRPIENFWGSLKQAVYDGNWRASTKKQLIRRIRQKVREVDVQVCQRLMSTLKTKVRRAADQDLTSVI